MSTEKRFTIGVLIGNASSPHTVALMKGIHEQAIQRDVNAIFYLGVHTTNYYRFVFTGDTSRDNYDYQCNVVYDYAWLGKVDALIISFGSLCIFLEKNDKQEFLKRFSGIPYVLVEDRDETMHGDSIITDNYSGMYALAEHLVRDHGYRRLTLLAGPKGNMDAIERRRAVYAVAKKYNLPFDESHIQYGDYSSCVEQQADALLDRFPDMQAMICANDTMAATVYRECEKRGLVVGQDIAITGFDDVSSLAPILTPPLTTVRQNAYSMGVHALDRAIGLCRGEKPHLYTATAPLVIRASCGCSLKAGYDFPSPVLQSREQAPEYTDQVADILTQAMLSPDVTEDAHKAVHAEIHRVLRDYILLYEADRIAEVNRAHLSEHLEKLLEGEYKDYIFANDMMAAVSAFLKNVISYETSPRRINELSGLMSMTTELIQAAVVKSGRDELLEFEKESWFMPLISRTMIDHIADEKQYYRAALEKIPALKAKSCYLYLLEKPLVHEYGEAWACPDKLYLAACSGGQYVEAYEPEKRPQIDKEHGFNSVCTRDTRYSYCVFPLFSGHTQYGMLMAEINPVRFNLLYLASLQINVGLEFYRLTQKQQRAQRTLEQVNHELNEKNEILGYISKYDPMTDCLNRRGFLEAGLEALHEHRGEKMRLFFADLDHLKEINDCFGHAEGDFAICTGARLLRDYFGKRCSIARLGGDEFVVLTAAGEPKATLEAEIEGDKQAAEAPLPSPAECVVGVHQLADAFNAESGKPYYVEISLGCKEFISTEAVKIVSILEDADRYLYDAKKMRRKSIRKNIDISEAGRNL